MKVSRTYEDRPEKVKPPKISDAVKTRIPSSGIIREKSGRGHLIQVDRIGGGCDEAQGLLGDPISIKMAACLDYTPRIKRLRGQAVLSGPGNTWRIAHANRTADLRH